MWRWLPLAVAIAVVCAVGIWTLSPRFELDTPSLVDDWWAIEHSPDQASTALRLGSTEEGRFRPGLILWSYLLWHTFDAPAGLTGPNVWNVIRLCVFVAGLCLLMRVALPPPRNPLESVLLAGIATLPALLVITVPDFAVDLARFGPQEPMQIGAMALGAALLVISVRRLLDSARRGNPWTAVAALAGAALWIFGVYQKEAAVCVLPLLAAAAYAGRSRLSGWSELGRGRRIALVGIAAAVLVPLVHVAVEALRIAARGDIVYDAEVDAGRGALRGLVELIERMPDVHTVFSQVVMALAVFAVVATAFARRFNVLALGALISGTLTLLFAAQVGVAPTRYYIPLLALFAVALSLSLASFGHRVQVVGLVLLAGGGLAYAPAAYDRVEAWTAGEREWAEFVRTVQEADASGCPVAVAGFEVEASQAIPVLVSLVRPEQPANCAEGETYLVVGPGAEGGALRAVCAPDASEAVKDWPSGSVYRCRRLTEGRVEDPELGSLAPQALIARRLLDRSGTGGA